MLHVAVCMLSNIKVAVPQNWRKISTVRKATVIQDKWSNKRMQRSLRRKYPQEHKHSISTRLSKKRHFKRKSFRFECLKVIT